MKIYIILILNVFCFWSCVTQQSGTGSKPNVVQTTKSSNVSEIEADELQKTETVPTPKIGRGNCLILRSFRVDTYIDNKLESRSSYRNGLLIKFVSFNSETKELTTEIEYFYKQNEEFDHQKVIRGKYVDDSEEMVLENKQAQKEIQLQCDFLKSKGIDFPLADIVADEINDLSNVFSVADNYHDFKTETQTDGNQKVIKFVGFNKTSRFHNSPITLLIGNGDFINIKDYELTLENGFPLKEIYRTPDGDLTKKYSYKNGKLTGVVYQFTDLQNQTNSLKKRFEYQELK